MKLQQLLEALKPSQYRDLVKGWDKSKYADLFGGKYRIYIPLGEKVKDVRVNPEVESFVKSQGYEIEDYLTGIASKDNGKRKVRIGKLLAKDPELKKLFDNDPSRNSSQTEYIVVISRHPYDIAGMTSGRAWEDESCMNLETGANKQFVPLDIKEGTLVAYLIKNIDKNIESPSARVLIKPFVNTDGSKDIAFGVEDKVYGKPSPEFKQTIIDWVDTINKKKKLNGIFELNKKLYNDSFKDEKGKSIPKIIGDASQDLLLVIQNITNIKKIKNPSEAVQMEVVKNNGKFIEFIVKKGIIPSELVQMAAVKQSGEAIQYIITKTFIPSEAVQLEAVKQDGYSIRYIVNKGIVPSEAVQKESVKDSYYPINYIKNPSEDVQLIAVKHNGMAIQYIVSKGITPSEAVQMGAVKQNIKAISYIKNPSEAVKKYVEGHK